MVPATLLMYERKQFPMPHKTALDMAQQLEIDKILLFNDFARFLNVPCSDVLWKVHRDYKLSQKDFAKRHG